MNMKVPETKKEVRQMLGFFSWFRDYIPDFALYAKPLTDFTGKRVPFNVPLSKIHQDAFVKLKELLCKATMDPLQYILLIFQDHSISMSMGAILRSA